MTLQRRPWPKHRGPASRLGSVATAGLLLLAVLAGGYPPAGQAQAAKGAGGPATPTAATAASTGLPTAAEIEARIKETESNTSLDETAKKAVLESLRRASTYLDATREFAAKAAEFTSAITSAPDQTAAVRKQLAADQGNESQPGPKALAALTADDLSGQLLKAQTEAAGIETRLADLDTTLEGSGSRPAEVRGRLVEIGKALEALEADAARPAAPDQAAEQVQAGAWRLAAQRQALTAEAQSLEQEAASQGVRDDLARLQREELTLTLSQVKERQRRLQEVQDQRRKAEAEQARRETEVAQRESADKHPLVQQAANDNALLTESLAELAEQLNQFNQQLEQTTRERNRIETDYRGARERIGIAGVNQALGMVMIDRRNALPDLRKFRKAIATRNDQIAEAALRQIRYREEQRALLDLETATAERMANSPEAQTDQVRGGVEQLLETRRALIDKALTGLQEYITKQGELNDATEQLIQTSEAYDAFLAQHLLWIRNARPISIETLSALPGAVAWMFSRPGWTEVIQVVGYEYRHSPLAWLGLAAVIVLFTRQAGIKRAILALAEPLRRVRTDRFIYTLHAIGLTWLAALPLPLACLLLGRELSGSVETTAFTRAVGHALIQVALGLYFLRIFRLNCMPGGVADRHFRWENDILVKIRQNLRWFTPYIVVVSLVAYVIYQSHDIAHGESLGRLAFIASTIGTAVFFGRLLHPGSGVFAPSLSEHPGSWANRLRNFWFPTIVGAPLALAILAALGYLYTAGTLFESLVQSAWLALALVLLQQVIVRWLVFTRRRLAFQAAMDRQTAKRSQAESAGARAEPRDGEAPSAAAAAEEPEVDLASLDEQTRKLLNATVFMLAVLGLWLIWAAMLPALGVFKQMALWRYTSVVDGVTRLVPVTAADVGLVLVILSVAVVAAKNLPALIEILLLQNSAVNAGTRYAVRTLVSYAITAIAIVMAFGTLGLAWSQIQWLVAALGVGIGFGLQEIVANFISGLIILFERPVRVGDTVTIANTTGTVSKIEIRATTIRNYERQELIVPNKEFITGRLLNWTLTDQINRIVITVGIEYGSDARLALTLLAEAAAANPRILKDPAPLASVDGFGDNALTLVLRCYLDSLDIRVGVSTELYLAIERAFREHGIGIAYPQRDINLTARDPIDVRLYRGERSSASTPAGELGSATVDAPLADRCFRCIQGSVRVRGWAAARAVRPGSAHPAPAEKKVNSGHRNPGHQATHAAA